MLHLGEENNMSFLELFFKINLLIMSNGILAALCYIIWKDMMSKERIFNIQMAQAEASMEMRSPLGYKEIKEIINDVAQYCIINYIIDTGINQKDHEELSIIIDDVLEELCTQIESYLGKDTIRQWNKIYTAEYLTEYIYRTTRIFLINEVEGRRTAPAVRPRPQVKQTPQKQTKKENGTH